jgi:hypothetical protein
MEWSEGWLWLSGSLFLAAFWANLAWFSRQSRSGIVDEFVTPLIAWRFSPWLLQLLRLLYYIGVPFAALLWGHEAYDVGWAAVLGIGVWALLALAWWTYRRALITADEGGAVAGTSVSGWVLLREAAYHEVHWAFYRNAPTLAWSAYWGVWGGLRICGWH